MAAAPRSAIAILDYGMGNLHSVANALRIVAPDAEVVVTADAAVAERADRIVFPGVGAIRDCMSEILSLGFDQILANAVAEKPVLGICVGMQALMQRSAENGGVDCLGMLPGSFEKFQVGVDERGDKLKVPHMGWSQVEQVDHPLWSGIAERERFYFVHSYYLPLAASDCVAARCHYGVDFAAAVARGNLFAVQFHPEKSATAGLQLLANFATWQGA